MTCKLCLIKPVIKLPNTNVKLCKNCFLKYFEKKALKTIRKYKLVEKEDKIGIGVSGGKDSTSVLYILNKFFSKRGMPLTAIAIDEGIKGYRDKTLKPLKKFCAQNKIKLKIYSFKKEFGKTLDQLVKIQKKKEGKARPCTICGVLRRYLLNKYSGKLKVTKLATGHNLDDEAQSILMNQFRRNTETSARLGPITGIVIDSRFVRRIKPLYFLTEKETTTYAFLKKIIHKFVECPYERYSYRCSVRDMLNDFEAGYPGTKHNIIASFLEILPLLKHHHTTKEAIKSCKFCKEPCSQDTCQACKLLKELK